MWALSKVLQRTALRFASVRFCLFIYIFDGGASDAACNARKPRELFSLNAELCAARGISFSGGCGRGINYVISCDVQLLIGIATACGLNRRHNICAHPYCVRLDDKKRDHAYAKIMTWEGFISISENF
jgi:hypothetical protein